MENLFSPHAVEILKVVLEGEKDTLEDEVSRRIKIQSQYRELTEKDKREIASKVQTERLLLVAKINENIEKDRKRLEEFEQKYGKTDGLPIRKPIRNQYGEIMTAREIRLKGLK